MAKAITRTVKKTTIHANKCIFPEGESIPRLEELEPLTVIDTACKNQKDAEKLLKKAYGNEIFCNIKMETEEQVYSLPLDVFMMHAEPITRPASQRPQDSESEE